MHSPQRNDSRAGAPGTTTQESDDAGIDASRARLMLTEYHAARTRANSAPIGSAEFREAMGAMQSLAAELEVLEVDPAESWRERTRRKLRLPVPAPRPGQRARNASATQHRA